MEDEDSEEKINFEEEELPQPPHWFICFFKVLANNYFGGLIGKNFITGKKPQNRFLSFVSNIFFLTAKALPIALFVSYFLITLPTWLFVLAIVEMTLELFILRCQANDIKAYLAKPQEPIKYSEEKQHSEEVVKNRVKVYQYSDKLYVYRWTTLIGNVFRAIGTDYFAFLFGKNLITRKKIKRSQVAKNNIINIISMLCFWALVIPCFLLTVPTWLFVLAIATAVSKLANQFWHSYKIGQSRTCNLFLCTCQGEGKIHASFGQVKEKNRADVPKQFKFINLNNIKNCIEDHMD